jgi:prepilin-type processing-associated H-X9-DG protein
MLPYMEAANFHAAIHFNLPLADPANAATRSTVVGHFRCPSDVGPSVVSVYDCGSPPSAANTPIEMLSGLAASSYVGSLGGAKVGGDPLYGCYEHQPFNGIFHRNASVRVQDINDGTSMTVGIGERHSGFVPSAWAGIVPGQEVVYNFDMQPSPYNPLLPACQNWRPALVALVAHSRQSSMNDPTGSTGQFYSPHVGGCNFLFMDGSAHFLNESIEKQTMWALCTRNNGEVISGDSF